MRNDERTEAGKNKPVEVSVAFSLSAQREVNSQQLSIIGTTKKWDDPASTNPGGDQVY